MKQPLSASAFALALAAGWIEPAAAQSSADAEIAAMRAELARLAARVDTLEAELAEAEARAPAIVAPAGTSPEADAAPAIAFKGAPEIASEDGWSFKPRGRLQYDVGTVSAPASAGRDDGFGSEARRIRVGASGTMPGNFGYKFEIDFADNDVELTDAIITYESGDVTVSVGQFNGFQSLEELTSSLHTSMIERAAFTDAFGFERRVGAGIEYASGPLLVQAGLFTDNIDALSNRNWSADGRIVAMPVVGKARFHLGASVHYTDLESGSTVRYRQRPLVHFTDDRWVDTRTLGAASEFGWGMEGAVISGPFHAAAETFWQRVSRPGAQADPTFFGGYAEVGMFLTPGDTRGYGAGKFDRTKPARPVGEGGWGSLQVNLRYDHLDLSDAGVIGGQQDGYLISLVWKPTDYTMLLANYGRLQYVDALFPLADGDRAYGVDAFGLRAQIDF